MPAIRTRWRECGHSRPEGRIGSIARFANRTIDHRYRNRMIEFRTAPLPQNTTRIAIAAGTSLDDALAQFGQRDDCIGCSTAAAAPPWTPDTSIDDVLRTFAPLSTRGPLLRPGSTPAGLFRRSSHWTEVDIDASAQRLRTLKMPANLIDAQRLIAVNDLRAIGELRPIVAIGLWAMFAHPIVRTGARFAGTRDGLTAEIALAVHPDRYIVIERDRENELVFVIETADPIAADLVSLSLRQRRHRAHAAGPWEDPLVQAATELDLGVRTFDQLDIDAALSPALSSERRNAAHAALREAAVSIGVRDYD